MADFVPITAEEWQTTDELWRMLHTALQSGAFTARNQLLFCVGTRRLAGERVPLEYRVLIGELETFADRTDLPVLNAGKQFSDVSISWNDKHPRHPGTPVANRFAEIMRACDAVMDRRILERLPPGKHYYEGDPGFEEDEAFVYAVLGHVFAACSHDEQGSMARSVPQADLLRDVLGNPFRAVAFDTNWRTDTTMSLAKVMYDSRDFGAMPILADALQDAGCDNEEVLAHCREAQRHFRGCWVCDLILGKS